MISLAEDRAELHVDALRHHRFEGLGEAVESVFSLYRRKALHPGHHSPLEIVGEHCMELGRVRILKHREKLDRPFLLFCRCHMSLLDSIMVIASQNRRDHANSFMNDGYHCARPHRCKITLPSNSANEPFRSVIDRRIWPPS